MADASRNPGWYPDPDGSAGERWWNGAGWSDARRGGAGAAASTPYGPGAVTPPTPAPGAVPPVPMAPGGAVPPPAVIYSAANPPPQRPDPYAAQYPTAAARSGTSINVQVNRNAMIGFVLGIVGLFANILFVVSPLAIVFSALGIVRARQLAAQGTKANLMVFAGVGLVTGIIGAIIGLIAIVSFFVGIATEPTSSA